MINVAIMAGGESRRFESDKTLAVMEGKPLIQHVAENLRGIADNIVVVAKDRAKYEFLEIPFLTDAYDVQCPMVGILTALKHFGSPVFAVSADAPFVSAKHVERMFAVLNGYDAVMPVIDGKQHPLYTVYNTSVINMLEDAVSKGDYALMKNLKKSNVMYIENKSLFDSEIEKKCFININTKEDFDLAIKSRGESHG
ncbi:MAG: molybdenum cofactor guanylyltransferase [Deferribacterales bacterium]